MLLGCVDFGCVDLVAGFVFLVFRQWVVWIVLLGLFRFWVAGLCGLCCWVMLIPGASILLLGLFLWFSVGGLCGFQCDTGVDCGCGSVAVWVKKFLPVGCVDSGVISV